LRLVLLCIEFSSSHTIRHTVGFLWTSDQPLAENSTYTGQHNIHALRGIRISDPSNQAAKTYALDPAATGIGSTIFIPSLKKKNFKYFRSHQDNTLWAIIK
jgi:hypothetical protein